MDECELHSYVSKHVAANEIMSRHRGCNLFFYIITWHGPTQLNFCKLFHKYAACLIKRNASLRRFFMHIAKK